MYAFDELTPSAWLNPEFLKKYEPLGVPVKLEEDVTAADRSQADRNDPCRRGEAVKIILFALAVSALGQQECDSARSRRSRRRRCRPAMA